MLRPMADKTAMKVTTVRFGTDLWTLLEHEARMVGVSVSQYIREAALARATAAGAARGDEPFELLAMKHDAAMAARHDQEESFDPAHRSAADVRSESRALRAESEQARRTARSKVEESASHRRERGGT
jgi:hypothetical protein